MKKSVLALFSVFLLMLFMNVFAFVQSGTDRLPQLKVENEKLEWKLKNQELKTMLASYELEDYRQNLASILPDQVKNNPKANYQLRNLASVVRQPLAQDLGIERASSLLVKAKKSFSEKEYVESNKQLKDLIEDYPDSVHAVEAYFLLIEGQYQVQDFENCVSSIDEMLSLYPANDLTGFAMLRLGKIFESQDRVDDAVDVYKALMKDFKNQDLRAQAEKNLKSIEL